MELRIVLDTNAIKARVRLAAEQFIDSPTVRRRSAGLSLTRAKPQSNVLASVLVQGTSIRALATRLHVPLREED